MSDIDTLLPPPTEPEHPTRTDYAVPSEPRKFDIETSDAPDWFKAFWRQHAQSREEERAILQSIERNQRIQTQEVRRLSRRVNDHDGELEELRERVEGIEDRISPRP